MARVKSLRLREGTRIANYRILRPLGRGWEGEVYAVEEVPTEAPRAMKLIAREAIGSAREITHAAWFFEQLAGTGAVARYFHMGQWFLEDDDGLFFLIFERLRGPILKDFLEDSSSALTAEHALRLVGQLVSTISRVHETGYALGDFETGDNIIVTGDLEDPRPIFCDCNPGKPDHPNRAFDTDLKALMKLAEGILEISGSSVAASKALDVLRATRKAAVTRETFTQLREKVT